ncbi:Uncharacterised protein [Vibrio cholerae]|nr:Uncharacterised protein [Vibrio cholerae]
MAADRPNQSIHVVRLTIFQMQRQATIGFFHHLFWHAMGVQLWPFRVHHFH